MPLLVTEPEQQKASKVAAPMGYVYILTNPCLPPDLLKIGQTTRTPEERAREISRGTGVPAPYNVAYCVAVSRCYEAERAIHKRLHRYRYNRGREFFSLPLDQAKRIVDEVSQAFREPVGTLGVSVVTVLHLLGGLAQPFRKEPEPPWVISTLPEAEPVEEELEAVHPCVPTEKPNPALVLISTLLFVPCWLLIRAFRTAKDVAALLREPRIRLGARWFFDLLHLGSDPLGRLAAAAVIGCALVVGLFFFAIRSRYGPLGAFGLAGAALIAWLVPSAVLVLGPPDEELEAQYGAPRPDPASGQLTVNAAERPRLESEFFSHGQHH